MDQLDYPSEKIWTMRQEWFESTFDVDKRGGAYMLGEQATGLFIDLQSIYCSGAFISCVIVACTIVDTHIREIELDRKFDGGIQAAFETSGLNQELEWLRNRRNRLVHFKQSKNYAITVDMQYSERVEYEKDAQRAIKLVADVFFENPSV